ncbi:MAG: GHKL domain-containing protein [Candidatus Eisenbacteria bacterium]|uniref:histidine kinase n=1 Tax=Eiseniibacteriota bacterium TaxID=2212470 RepID=A0A948RYM5_UNCEI|nr:GHKL domain-containing protein [Candidatus Eisenbacteria bacterium]MBU1947603.1 GHKL domain-containing protein [Candidatus Eisenbacteria bacterium]MBU2692371.1 GHKL domain-containing protein [Candidatus Eisenbacteria bacterium]
MHPRSIQIHCGYFLIICAFLGAYPVSAVVGSFRLEPVWESKIPASFPYSIWTIADVQGDGSEEITLALDNHTLQTRAFTGGAWRVLSQVNLRAPWTFTPYTTFCPCGDLDGDGVIDLAVSQSHDDTTRVVIIGPRNPIQLRHHFIPDANGDGIHDSRIYPIRAIDIPELGTIALITAYASGKDLQYRGVIAYSLQTGEELWHFDTGSNPYANSFRFYDLDGKPGDEIIFTMPSPNNGSKAGPTDDQHAWLVVLSDTGELLWLRRLGGYFCNPVWAEILELPGEPPSVITCARNNRTDEEKRSRELPDSIRVWNGRSGELIQTIVESRSVTNLVRLDHWRIAIGHVDGLVSVLGIEPGGVLFRTQRKQLAPRTTILGVIDFDGNGVSEIVCYHNNPKLQVSILNDRLGILARHDFGVSDRLSLFSSLRRAGNPPLFMTASLSSRSTFVVQPLPWWEKRNAAIGAFSLVAMLLSLLIVIRVRRSMNNKLRIETERPLSSSGDMKHLRKALLMASEVTSHGRLAATHVVERILWLLEAIGSQPQATPESITRLESAVKNFQDVTTPQIKNILALCSALQVEPSCIQEIAADIAELRIQLDKLRRSNWSPSSVYQSLPQIRQNANRLVSGMQEIRSVAKKYVTVPLKPEIERACAAIIDPMENIQATIEVRMEPGIGDTFVRASKDDLAFILENLLSNALRAIEQTPLKQISIATSLNGRYACIEISDTGIGIPPEDAERIFNFGVSNRESGGTGLHASRRLLDELGGELHLKESRPGLGTTMELRLLIESVENPRGGRSQE